MTLSPYGFRLFTRKRPSVLSILTLPLTLSSENRNFHCSFGAEGLVCQEPYSVERFVSFIETCQDIESLWKLHGCVVTYGFESNIFLGTKLLNCYANFGRLTESRWVFDKIANRNPSLWNSIIIGYFRSGHFSEVLCRYLNLKQRGIGIDSSALTFALKSCIELGIVEFGRGIHVDAFKFGLYSDRFVGSSLIGLYSKYGCIKDARQVFEGISEKDVVAYTAMISGYSLMDYHHAYEAFIIAWYMQKERLEPNRVTLVSLLQAASQLEALNEGRMVLCYAIRRGMDCFDEVLETSLLDMYIKCGAPEAAKNIFNRMEMRSIASWNAMISGLVQCGQPSEALKLFYVMKQGNLMPDLITLANVLLGCADLKLLCHGKSIHGYIIRAEIYLDLVAITALIDMYSKCDRANKARELFDRMDKRDVISFNVMIAGYLQNGLTNEAIKTFAGMIAVDIRPNPSTILSILSASSDLMDIKKGRLIHGYVVRYGIESDVEVANQIIDMYAKCGSTKNAWEMFNGMKHRDIVSWTTMMMGYVSHGHADEALTLFRLMHVAGEEPDSVTLLSLLQSFSQLGCLKLAEEVHGHVYRFCLDGDTAVMNSLVTTYAKCGRLDIAKVLFDNMRGRGLVSWNTMIAAYGMHGNCVGALDQFHRMQEENVKPDELTFTSVLSACSHAGLVEEGWCVFRSMSAEHSITPREEHYSCMVDLLGRAGQLEEAYNFVECSPVRDSANALGALLAACRVHRNTELGDVVGRKLLDVEPNNPSVYTMVSNMYAEASKWSEVERIRDLAKARSLRKIPGYSLMEYNKQVCEAL